MPREVVYRRCACGNLAHPCYGHRCENCYAGCQPLTRPVEKGEKRTFHSPVAVPQSDRVFGTEK